jgi:hypothetical protein
MRQFTTQLLSVAIVCCMAMTAFAQTHVLTVTLGSFPLEQSYDLNDGVTSLSSTGCGTLTATIVHNLTLVGGTTYTFDAFDDWGDGWNGGTWSVTDIVSGCEIAGGLASDGLAGDNTDDCIGQSLEESVSFDPGAPISGCTNPTSINYNACATVDDGTCISPSTNDACADAIAIPSGTCYVGSNTGATFGGDTLDIACVDGSTTPSDIWFSTTVPASGTVDISFPVIPGFSSIIELYEGTCGALGTQILASIAACNNYGAGSGLSIGGLTPGATLLIRYWDFGSDQEGGIEICVSEPSSGCTDPCASNYDSLATIDDGSCSYGAYDVTEDCASATTLVDGSYSVLNSGATADVLDITSCTFNDVIAVWAKYDVPVGADTLKVWTCGSSFDTGLSLWSGCPSDTTSVELGCNDDGQVAVDPSNPFSTSSCGGAGFQSAIILSDIALDALEGTTVWIRVAGYNGASGCGDLNISSSVATCDASAPPTNPTHTTGASAVTLSWDALPLSVACQVSGTRITPPGPSPSVNLFGAEPNTTNVPYAVAGAGTTWTYKVRCACSTSPVIATGFSVTDTFSVPLVRLNLEDVQMLYPNPADNVTFVSYVASADASNVEFAVIDMMGRVLEVKAMDIVSGLNSVQFDVANLEEGAYFVQITNGAEVSSEQFTIAR